MHQTIFHVMYSFLFLCRYVMRHLDRHWDGGEQELCMEETTYQTGIISLQGPGSKDLLEQLTQVCMCYLPNLSTSARFGNGTSPFIS